MCLMPFLLPVLRALRRPKRVARKTGERDIRAVVGKENAQISA
jgi:hypothetical protein